MCDSSGINDPLMFMDKDKWRKFMRLYLLTPLSAGVCTLPNVGTWTKVISPTKNSISIQLRRCSYALRAKEHIATTTTGPSTNGSTPTTRRCNGPCSSTTAMSTKRCRVSYINTFFCQRKPRVWFSFSSTVHDNNTSFPRRFCCDKDVDEELSLMSMIMYYMCFL